MAGKNQKRGAGIIPFAVQDGQLWFLLHKTFKGRRAGLWVDFGGGGETGESFVETAVREFIEETEGMFLAPQLPVTEREKERQKSSLTELLEVTQNQHPNWRLRRKRLSANCLLEQKFKDWQSFFVQVEYRCLVSMNRAWEKDNQKQFVKRRMLVWIPAEHLLALITTQPQQLWKRVRELYPLEQCIRDMLEYFAAEKKSPYRNK